MAKSLARMESFATDENREVEMGEDLTADSQARSPIRSDLRVAILASRFAANTRRGIQKIKDEGLPKLAKPDEPDFSVEADD